MFNSLSVNPKKWSNTLKQFVGNLWYWRLISMDVCKAAMRGKEHARLS